MVRELRMRRGHFALSWLAAKFHPDFTKVVEQFVHRNVLLGPGLQTCGVHRSFPFSKTFLDSSRGVSPSSTVSSLREDSSSKQGRYAAKVGQ